LRGVTDGTPAAFRRIMPGSGHRQVAFALVAVEGRTVRMARSMDRPMRYFALFPGETVYAAGGGITPRRKREERKQKPLGDQARSID